MARYMFMDGPFKQSVIQTEATIEELNSKPDIEIVFVTGPLCGLVSHSLICYDRKLIRAVELFKEPIKLDISIRYTTGG
ncbi:hypothetical protein HWC54_gp108 [Klebsiella phage Marfa]|uniref:Uncharacterized protein n=1 Tax=Klebsiella phage Marfa TaxID=2587809 RepID=A0A4Y5TRU6_9CAUD|nr:hypothetical protein HWC54_gp108 [Klebsiella phage Marfa]QDB71763.1 hypothetical protein CPT_Marfa_108 [Klebsiella phage Marfa]